MASADLIVYEDCGWQRLLPLVYTRAVFQLVCGMGDLVSRVQHLSPNAPLSTWCRPHLGTLATEETGLRSNQPLSRPTLLLNGRARWRTLPPFDPEEESWLGTSGPQRQITCIWADAKLAASLTPQHLLDPVHAHALLAGLPQRDIGTCATLFDWPWQIVLANEAALSEDWQQQGQTGQIAGQIDQGSHILNPQAVRIGPGSRIKPCAVIDAEDGPVWIGNHVTILPHTYIQGPAYIGDGSLIQPGASVREGCFIGPECKIGGEIEASIVQGYSNKQHDGFLGHGYIGSWVNIAADCINSDLKNTYGNVRVPINGYEVDSGETFVGMLVGDHSKLGINVSCPTGAVIGFCSSVFAPRSPKFVPSFTWVDSDRVEPYDEAGGLGLARKVMARRQQTMSPAAEAAFRAVTGQALTIERKWSMTRAAV